MFAHFVGVNEKRKKWKRKMNFYNDILMKEN